MKKTEDKPTKKVEVADLEAMVDFYRNILYADNIYKACQDKAFRQHAKSCLSAAKAEAAFRKVADMVGKEV